MTWGLRAFGLIMALVVWLAMGFAEELSPDARWVATIATLMAIWWMTEAIPLSATALLPIVLIPMLTARTVGEATAPYASSIVFLFLGGFLIAIAMEKWNLHRRIALLTLARGRIEPKRIVLGMMLATGFLSMWVSNTATAATFIPVLGGVAVGIGADPMTLLIPAAFAATCAFMLPVGTPPNAIVFGTGAVTIAQMARGGIVLNIIGIVLITLFCYMIGGFALGLQF